MKTQTNVIYTSITINIDIIQQKKLNSDACRKIELQYSIFL